MSNFTICFLLVNLSIINVCIGMYFMDKRLSKEIEHLKKEIKILTYLI